MNSPNALVSDLFCSPAWFETLQAYGFTQPPVCHVVRQAAASGEVILPLMQGQGGTALSALSNYYSCLFGPMGPARELGASQWREIGQKIRSLPGSSILQLQPLDAEAAWLAGLECGLCAAGYWSDRFFCFGNWYQPVPVGGFAAYWAARPSALRRSVERGRRRLDKAGDWRLEIVSTDFDALESAIAAYVTVYNQSWKQPEPCPDFMPGLIRTAAREGWLRLGIVWCQSEPIAAQVWLVQGGKANIYKLAYVKGFEKLSAGSVLTAALMEHVMDVDRVGEVDYLSGDDAYKADWMALRRERIGLVAFDQRHWRGWMAGARHLLGRWRQRWLAS